MKRFVWLLLVLFLAGLVVGAEDSNAEDVEAIQGAIDDYTPINEDGEFDVGKFKPFKSKAQERIDAVNLWFEENASWLKVVFGMVPEVSWLFALSFFFFLFFLLVFVINGPALFSFWSEGRARLLGAAIFFCLILVKINYYIAEGVYKFFVVIWNTILPWGTAIAVIVFVVIGLFFPFLLAYIPRILMWIKNWSDARKERKAKAKQASNRKVLETVVEGITGN